MGIHTQRIETGVDTSAPLKTLYHSHDTILTGLAGLLALPRQVQQAADARKTASEALDLFEREVLQHHADEEKSLFPAVLSAAADDEERAAAQALVTRLVDDHRALEAMWRELAPAVRAVRRGRGQPVDAALVARLVDAYTRHAHAEEEQFLPLAQTILQRDRDLTASVGLGLHIRRLPDLPGYI